jgi:threonine/homoserine efflux transporter RhtA
MRAVGLAMGAATVVTCLLGLAEAETIITLIAIGILCLGIATLSGYKDDALDEI